MQPNLNTKEQENQAVHPLAGIQVLSGREMEILAGLPGVRESGIVKGGILGEQEKAITYADPKHLKTMWEMWKAMCVASGVRFFGFEVKQGKVLYIGMEDSLRKLAGRVKKLLVNFPDEARDNFHYTVLPVVKRDVATIEALIVEYQPVYVIVDPLTNLLGKEDKKENVDGLLKEFDRLIERYGVSVQIIHHARKQKGETLESMRGSSALPGWADTIIRIQRVNRRKDKIRIQFESRHAEEELDDMVLNFRRRDNCQFVEDTGKRDEVQRRIAEILGGGRVVPLAEVRDDLEDLACSRTIDMVVKSMPDVEEIPDPQDGRRRLLRNKEAESAAVPSVVRAAEEIVWKVADGVDG